MAPVHNYKYMYAVLEIPIFEVLYLGKENRCLHATHCSIAINSLRFSGCCHSVDCVASEYSIYVTGPAKTGHTCPKYTCSEKIALILVIVYGKDIL